MPATVNLPLNQTCIITVNPLDAAGNVVPIPAPPTWVSATPETATVKPVETLVGHVFEALVTPLATGSTAITVSAGTVTDDIDVTVVAAVTVPAASFKIQTLVQ